MGKIKVNDIPRDGKYEGYIWMSNSTRPQVLESAPLPADFSTTGNPFVVEAELWDKDNRLSYSIHHAGNQTVCQCSAVADNDFSSDRVDKTVYVSHRMDGLQLCFLEYWEEAASEACLGMPVLEMSKRVFVGFKGKEK